MTGGKHFFIRVQDRDLRLLLGLFESRVANREHLAALYFEGRLEAARKRLQKLKTEGLVTFRSKLSHEPTTFCLTRAGFDLLQKRSLLGWYPHASWAKTQRRLKVSPLTLQHELDVVGVKAHLVEAIRRNPCLRVLRFSTWPALHEFTVGSRKKGPVVKPDGYLHLEQKNNTAPLSDHHFFIEVDGSTESSKVVLKKCVRYLNHYKSGGFAVSQGASPDRYKQLPFRVLIVCKSQHRRNNLAVRLVTGKPTIRALVWLTTKAEFKADPLGTIWVKPGIYQQEPGTDAPESIQKFALLDSRNPDR